MDVSSGHLLSGSSHAAFHHRSVVTDLQMVDVDNELMSINGASG